MDNQTKERRDFNHVKQITSRYIKNNKISGKISEQTF